MRWSRPGSGGKASAVVQALSSQEPFMIWIKAAFFTGLLIASPYIFWQLWSFIGAGLYSHEKKYVHIFVPISLVLFWSGALIAFFFAFKYVLAFLFGFNRALDIQAEPRISEWIGFVLMLPLGFGVAFQLPLVMFFLNRVGMISVKAYIEKWRVAILTIFVVSMVLTPADPVSMLLMAVPLCGLYFLGIGMSQWMPRQKSLSRRVRTVAITPSPPPLTKTATSDGFRTAFTRADAEAILERQDEDLAVTDLALLARPRAFENRLNGRLDELLVDGDLQLDFPQQIDRESWPR